MYIVLSGARQNLGDYLIGERCKALLAKHKPGEKLIQFDSADSLENHIDTVNQSEGIIIMGGPGYRPNMYPSIYKLTTTLRDIKVPIYLLGMGWKGSRGDLHTIRKYRFDQPSLDLLKLSHDRSSYLGCRDWFTWQVLMEHGFTNVLMTGCPAWYDIDSLNSKYMPPEKFEVIAFTPPVTSRLNEQSISIVKLLLSVFPKSQIKVFFHHGFFPQTTGPGVEDFFKNQRKLRDSFSDIGCICEDISGSSEGIKRYRTVDLHVGYRVHAHIDCLSRRRTSILFYEDGRGEGVDNALGIRGISAWKLKCIKRRSGFLNKILGHDNVYTKKEVNTDADELLRTIIKQECSHHFVSYHGLDKKIDRYYKHMVQFISSL